MALNSLRKRCFCPMFYPLLYSSFALKTMIMGKISVLITKHKAADKNLEQRHPKEFKTTCKNSGESEQNNKKLKKAVEVGSAPSLSIIPSKKTLFFSSQEEIQQFKDQFIYKHIIDTEMRENVYPLLTKTQHMAREVL